MKLKAAISLLAASLFIYACSNNTLMPPVGDGQWNTSTPNNDPYLWLEDIHGGQSLQWVDQRNNESLPRLTGDPRFQRLLNDALSEYNAQDKIPYASLYGDKVHDFWQDAESVRGIWREADYESYISGKPRWKILLDLDVLAADEDENWVYREHNCLKGTGRCLLSLSRGGGDAIVVREFDTATRTFVEKGFYSPESIQWVDWVDTDRLLIAKDFGKGSMGVSGYPSQVRLWDRGSPLASSKLISEDKSLAFTIPTASHRADGTVLAILEGENFFNQRIKVIREDKALALALPKTLQLLGFYRNRVVVMMMDDWRVSGELIASTGQMAVIGIDDAIEGRFSKTTVAVVGGKNGSVIDNVVVGKDKIYISVLNDVKSSLLTYRINNSGASSIQRIEMPSNGAIKVMSTDTMYDRALINYESHLTPSNLFLVEGSEAKSIYSLPERFDQQNLTVQQKFATSTDGTQVPYFIVHRKDMRLNGETPTLLNGYGAFQVSFTPEYLNGMERLWVQEGGAFVVANIRGGGEYGAAWHQAAVKQNRQRSFDDFIAVGESLIETGVTSSKKLGIWGGSAGGLLMGVAMTQRPDLWRAVVCAVPLLDMYRFNKLLRGQLWESEFGDPDIPGEWAYIEDYSPYHNISANADYPEVFIYTSTNDDRVHPGHARKMAHKMMDQGHDVIYYENTEGGHASTANLKQKAFSDAMRVVYLLQKLSD